MSLSATQSTTLPTCGENGVSLPARDKQRMVNLWKELKEGIDPDDEETKSRIRILVARTVRDRPDSAMKHCDAHLDLELDVPCDWPAELSSLGAKTEDVQDQDDETVRSGSAAQSGLSNNNPTNG